MRVRGLGWVRAALARLSWPVARPPRPLVAPGLVIGVALAVVAGAGVAPRWRPAVVIALALGAALALAVPVSWWTGTLACAVSVACAAGPTVDLAPLRVASVAALLTGFVAVVHWPGRAAISGPAVLVAVIGVPLAATVAAAAELHALGAAWFVVGLVAGLLAVLLGLGPLLRWASSGD